MFVTSGCLNKLLSELNKYQHFFSFFFFRSTPPWHCLSQCIPLHLPWICTGNRIQGMLPPDFSTLSVSYSIFLVLLILFQVMSLFQSLLHLSKQQLVFFYNLSLSPLKANLRFLLPVLVTRPCVSVQFPENLLLQSLQSFQTKVQAKLVRYQMHPNQ